MQLSRCGQTDADDQSWRDVLEGYVGGMCWRDMLEGCVGGICWRDVLEAELCQEQHEWSEHIRTARDVLEAAGAVRVVGGVRGRAVHQKQIEMLEADGVDRSVRSVRGGQRWTEMSEVDKVDGAHWR
jgi:hypothetical protein